jgi:hypothetical protein
MAENGISSLNSLDRAIPALGEDEGVLGEARISATEDIHHSVKRFSREASQIAPDWSRGKEPRLNLCSQVLDGEGFDL